MNKREEGKSDESISASVIKCIFTIKLSMPQLMAGKEVNGGRTLKQRAAYTVSHPFSCPY